MCDKRAESQEADPQLLFSVTYLVYHPGLVDGRRLF